MSSFDDPEISYRRGYEHGAWQLFEDIETLLPEAVRSEIRSWVYNEVHSKWRVPNLAGETGRRRGYIGPTVDIAPPRFRLRRRSPN
jgi:hypothetical protein